MGMNCDLSYKKGNKAMQLMCRKKGWKRDAKKIMAMKENAKRSM